MKSVLTRFLLLGPVLVGFLAASISIAFAIADSGDSYDGPYLTTLALHCEDGTVLRPHQPEFANFCPPNVGGVLHFAVAMPNGGVEYRQGMTPYWPPHFGDCWPTFKENTRTVCSRLD